MNLTFLNYEEKSASAGNRTRIYCLEGNNANLYTTDAMPNQSKYAYMLWKNIFNMKKIIASAGNRTRIYCLEGNNANLYTTDALINKPYQRSIYITSFYLNR
jgi:uncharacterized protein (UPF0333 family)